MPPASRSGRAPRQSTRVPQPTHRAQAPRVRPRSLPHTVRFAWCGRIGTHTEQGTDYCGSGPRGFPTHASAAARRATVSPHTQLTPAWDDTRSSGAPPSSHPLSVEAVAQTDPQSGASISRGTTVPGSTSNCASSGTKPRRQGEFVVFVPPLHEQTLQDRLRNGLDEDQASTSARAAPTSLLHLWEAAVTRLLSPSMR